MWLQFAVMPAPSISKKITVGSDNASRWNMLRQISGLRTNRKFASWLLDLAEWQLGLCGMPDFVPAKLTVNTSKAVTTGSVDSKLTVNTSKAVTTGSVDSKLTVNTSKAVTTGSVDSKVSQDNTQLRSAAVAASEVTETSEDTSLAARDNVSSDIKQTELVEERKKRKRKSRRRRTWSRRTIRFKKLSLDKLGSDSEEGTGEIKDDDQAEEKREENHEDRQDSREEEEGQGETEKDQETEEDEEEEGEREEEEEEEEDIEDHQGEHEVQKQESRRCKTHGSRIKLRLKEKLKKRLVDRKGSEERVFESFLNPDKRNRRKKLCYQCGRTFDSRKPLEDHMKVAHCDGKPQPLYLCELCGKEFFSQSAYSTHKMVHTGRTFPCQLCGREFTHKHNMLEHVNRVHLKIRDHSCSECGFTCRRKLELEKHKKEVHMKIRDLKCSWEGCGKMFKAERHLKVHLRIHTGEKPYKCTYCEYTCSQKASLNWHIKKHERDMEITRNHCSMSSGQPQESLPPPVSDSASQMMTMQPLDGSIQASNDMIAVSAGAASGATVTVATSQQNHSLPHCPPHQSPSPSLPPPTLPPQHTSEPPGGHSLHIPRSDYQMPQFPPRSDNVSLTPRTDRSPHELLQPLPLPNPDYLSLYGFTYP